MNLFPGVSYARITNMEHLSNNNQVCVIGAGIAGLTTAVFLARQNIPVTVIEKQSSPGGLLRSISLGNERIERFYHFICMPDVELIRLIEEVGLKNKLHWRSVKTSYFQESTLYPFSTPFDLLRFKPIPFLQRLRFGLNILRSRYRENWHELDSCPAKDWLIQRIGIDAYEKIWKPLLLIKFGHYHEQISAAWLWHRINRVARSRKKIWQRETMGYVENGFDHLINALLAELKARNVRVLLNTPVTQLLIHNGKITGVSLESDMNTLPCRAACSTIPLTLLSGLVKESESVNDSRFKKAAAIAYIGVVCVLLQLKHPLTESFWVNVNSSRIPFNGFIEYTNLNRHFDHGNSHLVYIPFYVPVESERYQQADDTLLEECFTAIKFIQPHFNADWVINSIISREMHAQPICTTGFSTRIPAMQGTIKGLFISDASQIYPEDRTVSGMIRQATQIAQAIREEW